MSIGQGKENQMPEDLRKISRKTGRIAGGRNSAVPGLPAGKSGLSSGFFCLFRR